MMIVFMTILKKLATICWRVVNDDQHRFFRRSPVAPASITGSAATGRKKRQIRELSDNGYSALETLSLEWEKPPPFAGASPLNSYACYC